MMTRQCPFLPEMLVDGRYIGRVHEVDLTARMVTVPVEGGGALRVVVCAEHAADLEGRFAEGVRS